MPLVWSQPLKQTKPNRAPARMPLLQSLVALVGEDSARTQIMPVNCFSGGSMKQPKLSRLALLTVFSVLVYHGIVASPARAGGGDLRDAATTAETANCSTEPIADASGNSPNAEANRKCKQKPRTFDWRYWSQPASHGQNLCREHLGNTVCLTSTSATKLRW